MDILSSLIGAGGAVAGAGVGGIANYFTNLMNKGQQQWSAEGGYLPGLVANAAKVGLSPLAVLGQHAPSAGGMIPLSSGEGVERAGEALSQLDPHLLRMQNYAEARASAEVKSLEAGIDNERIAKARNQFVLDYLAKHPDAIPEGVTYSVPAMGADWLTKLNQSLGDFGRRLGGPTTPSGSYNTP